jgi:hypothetical protein
MSRARDDNRHNYEVTKADCGDRRCRISGSHTFVLVTAYGRYLFFSSAPLLAPTWLRYLPHLGVAMICPKIGAPFFGISNGPGGFNERRMSHDQTGQLVLWDSKGIAAKRILSCRASHGGCGDPVQSPHPADYPTVNRVTSSTVN